MTASDDTALLTVIVPGDPNQNTGGYRYVGRLVAALNDSGRPARVVGVGGQFPRPDRVALAAVNEQLEQLAGQSVVVLDGLAMGGMPDIIERHADRLVIIALVHHPLADETGLEPDRQTWFFESEKRALASVRGVVATSDFTASRLADLGVPASRVRVARPGVDVRSPGRGASAGDRGRGSRVAELLCVAHLSPRKAQLHLVDALAQLVQLSWHCTLIGSDQRDTDYGRHVKAVISSLGLQDRITVAGELESRAVDEAYRAADLFVFPSLYEGYGMAIDEALAVALPVVTSNGGALARVADEPGVRSYPAGDTDALAAILGPLLAQPQQLDALKREAVAAQATVQTWDKTAEAFVLALEELTGGRDATVFDAGWLAMREPADHRARDPSLTDQLVDWVVRRYQGGNDRGPIAIADLGSGGGSNARYLSPGIGVPQHWTLLDQDPELMVMAMERLETLGMNVNSVVADLAPDTLALYLPANVEVITASALIDLVSQTWLESLAHCADERQAAVFVVLSYSGHFRLYPEHAEDDLVRQLVNDHQHGDKGTGAALGPEAPSVLKRLMTSRGYRVSTACSPWRLGASEVELQLALMQGWCAAATEQLPQMTAQIRRWLGDRQQQAARGELVIEVGHEDLLALPAVDAHG